ncbi:GTPase [Cenarchaeum symbiosum A]|uniref:GTPase n=1 Tax=Cenarchaeum symbiosum (strain A) TaxID=414004 RepID=A0RX98_CENSY|nr:GTPase [Cenarchaeum symbiosum A]
MAVRIGIIGKTNTGKTTFFNSATLSSSEVSTYPFTTKQPASSEASAITLCVHREFGVEDNPRNSRCVDGWRHTPIELMDLPGLVKGAWRGKGLGNRFLSIAAQSDALLHVVDASGGIDPEGRITEAGAGDPVSDFADIEEELVMWYHRILEGNREKLEKLTQSGASLDEAISGVYTGVGVSREHAAEALRSVGLEGPEELDVGNSKALASRLYKISKPSLIVANKMDRPGAAANFERLRERYSDMMVVPASADSELSLRRAEQKGLIRYEPGAEQFEIIDSAGLSGKQSEALKFITSKIMGEYMRTGVQFAINTTVFKLLKMNAIYPVADGGRLSDKKGNVLPDLVLMKDGATVLDLAKEVHTDLARGLLYAKDLRNNLRLPPGYQLRDRDVVSLVSAEGRHSIRR